jgi:prepilin-type N-terminal cleavage/methylation domain-containing protein
LDNAELNMGGKYRDPTRRGLTLIEVILVLSLMVVIAAFCWPALNKAFSSQRLKKAADIVRTQWSKARVKSMSENCIVLFYYEMDGSRFRIRQLSDMDSLGSFADDAAMADPNAALGAAPPGGATAETADGTSDIFNYPSPSGVQSLPTGIVFRAGQIENDSRALTVGESTLETVSDALWSAPIYFYPDGTSSSARLQICNDRNLAIELSLRGMTGVARVGDIDAAEGAVP